MWITAYFSFYRALVSVRTPLQLPDGKKWSSGHSWSLAAQVTSPVFGLKSKFRVKLSGYGTLYVNCDFYQKTKSTMWAIYKVIIYYTLNADQGRDLHQEHSPRKG